MNINVLIILWYVCLSYMIGMVTSSYDIAAMIVTPLISYIGGSRKKPAFCAWGVFTMGVGFFIFMLPHFVSPPYEAGRCIRLTSLQLINKWKLYLSRFVPFIFTFHLFQLLCAFSRSYVTRLFETPPFLSSLSSLRSVRLPYPSLPTHYSPRSPLPPHPPPLSSPSSAICQHSTTSGQYIYRIIFCYFNMTSLFFSC